MAKKKLKPVSIWGIEFDAKIDEQKSLASTIPAYPVEEGFPVTDSIINSPMQIKMNLYVSNTPVTWLYRHGSSSDRVKKICKQIENSWKKKKLAKIVTSDAIYKDMGINDISIKQSQDEGFSRVISITATKVYVTKRKSVKIPKNILKSGASMAKAGKASASSNSNKSSNASSAKSSSKSSSKNGSKKSSSNSAAKKSQSILYGAAKYAGLV